MEEASEQEKQTSVWAARERQTSFRGWWEDVLTWRSPPLSHGTSRICPQPHLLFQFYQPAIWDFFLFSQKNRPSKGFKPQRGISSSYQLKLIQPQPGTFCYCPVCTKNVSEPAANFKPNSRGEFLRFGLVQLSHHMVLELLELSLGPFKAKPF